MQKEGGDDNHKRQHIQAWFSAAFSELDSAGDFLGIALNNDEKARLRSGVEKAMRWVSENEHLPLHELLERVNGQFYLSSIGDEPDGSTEVQDLVDKLEHRGQRHDEL